MRKKLNFLRKFSNSINPPDEDYKNITIRRSKKKSWIKSILKTFIIVFISSMLGASISVYIITNKYVNNIMDKLNNTNLTAEMINQSQNYVNGVVQQVASSIVTIGGDEKNLSLDVVDDSNVTGVIVRSDGYILTSYGAIRNLNNIYVKLPSSGSTPLVAKMIGEDELSDLAILKIEADQLPKAKFGDTSQVELGEKVIAIGNSSGDEYVGMVTTGIITSTKKKVRLSDDQLIDGFVYNVIETDAIINSDNNGGVLCNLDGEIIGINSLHLGNEFSNSSLNYAIDAKDVQEIIDLILSYKEKSTISLGIDGVTFIKEDEEGINGVYIRDIIKDGSAEEAGIRPMDIIVELDNKVVTKAEDIIDILNNHQLGDIVNCKFMREGTITEVMVTLKEKK